MAQVVMTEVVQPKLYNITMGDVVIATIREVPFGGGCTRWEMKMGDETQLYAELYQASDAVRARIADILDAKKRKAA